MACLTADDFEGGDEPSVLSSDPHERKLARSLRIQKRIEALERRREAYEEESTAEPEESLTERQIIASAELLEKLLAEGNEVVSNVRVANDARELARRKHAAEVRAELSRHLEESASECQQQYEAITDRWAEILRSNDPLDISAEMQAQKRSCDQVLAQKDEVIAQLKLELSRADEQYLGDLSQQKRDVSLLLERIESQMATIESVYDRELAQVEASLAAEREALLAGFRARWDTLHAQQQSEDLACDQMRSQISNEYEAEMDRTMIERDEEYRATKIELERECQAMQRQVEQTKAMCLLNAEKLSYNYSVLKSREEENSIVKSQQKRKINKLQSLVNALQKHYSDLQQSTKLEIDKLSSQIVKTHQNINDIERKSIHFTRVNEKQYWDIWRMNDENATELVKKIFSADKMIHERILGLLWEPPEKALPCKEDLPSYRRAVELIQKQKQGDARQSGICSGSKLEKSLSEWKLERQVLNNILRQLSDCSGYLVETKLQELISQRSDEEKCIVKLDNVFQALSISSPEEIDVLLDFFLPYSHCPKCQACDDASSKTDQQSSTVSTQTTSCSETCEGCYDENVRKLIKSVECNVAANKPIDNQEEKNSLERCCEKDRGAEFDDQDEHVSKATRLTCDKGHVLEIQAACVTKALKEMISKCNRGGEGQALPFESRIHESTPTISRNLSAEDVKAYWSSYRNIFGVQREQLWDAVLVGMTKYYEVLKERHKLCNERDCLKKQNEELQRLLETRTTSPDDNLSILQVSSTKHLAYE